MRIAVYYENNTLIASGTITKGYGGSMWTAAFSEIDDDNNVIQLRRDNELDIKTAVREYFQNYKCVFTFGI